MGEPFDDLEAIALKEPWARALIYSDIEGFAVTTDGELILLDECGNRVYPPPELLALSGSDSGGCTNLQNPPWQRPFHSHSPKT